LKYSFSTLRKSALETGYKPKATSAITQKQKNKSYSWFLVEVLLELRNALLADQGSHVLGNVNLLHLNLDAELVVLIVGPGIGGAEGCETPNTKRSGTNIIFFESRVIHHNTDAKHASQK
jgi:hypothetical protein